MGPHFPPKAGMLNFGESGYCASPVFLDDHLDRARIRTFEKILIPDQSCHSSYI